tara:strand:+ start:102 stop:755 length:654 start_codon:yes stop_codon:yes gene_type:complete
MKSRGVFMLNHGDIFKTNNYGSIKVINRVHSKLVVVEFIDTGYTCTATEDNAKNGRVKDKIKPVIFAVGFIGDGKYSSTSRYYSIWHNMLDRCYSTENDKNSAYSECVVCDEWLNFQSFAIWCDVNYIDGYEIDKDIMVRGNKIYSPIACSFVSQEENKKNKPTMQKNNTSGVKGVNFDSNSSKWLARKSIGKGKRVRVGLFTTVEEAKLALDSYIT